MRRHRGQKRRGADEATRRQCKRRLIKEDKARRGAQSENDQVQGQALAAPRHNPNANREPQTTPGPTRPRIWLTA